MKVSVTKCFKIKLLIFLVLTMVSISIVVAQSSVFHPVVQLNFVKSKIRQKQEPYWSAYQDLIHLADSLPMNHHAIENLSIPGFYSDKKKHREVAMNLQKDAFAAYSAALAFRLNGKKKYAKKALYFLNAWAAINKEYDQLDGSLVMSYAGSGLMIAAGLMQNTKAWKVGEQQQFKHWTQNVFQKATHSIRSRHNNSGDWSRFSALLAAAYLRDTADFNVTTNLIKNDLFDKIAVDGHMVEEVKREGKGLWYTYFSLAPLTASMWTIFNMTGENLFFVEQNGASLLGALRYLSYYTLHPDEWRWYKNPDVATPKTITGFWPPNLMEAMKDVYREEEFETFAAPYRPIIFQKHHFAWTFPTLMPLNFDQYKSKN
ncbi:alginate lyase family protein [Sphingobacterium sp. WOUb80]|uniref:alginate lyase family protein n=1 Tax=Sphingobacterium sp. WOUb80 TaxID=3234028 RepID=UPI003CED400F